MDGDADDHNVNDELQRYAQDWFPQRSIYFWNAKLQTLQDRPNVKLLTSEQRQIYHSLCDKDVQEIYAYTICQNIDLYRDFTNLSVFSSSHRLIGYWICTYQSSFLEELRSHPNGYELIGTQILHVERQSKSNVSRDLSELPHWFSQINKKHHYTLQLQNLKS